MGTPSFVQRTQVVMPWCPDDCHIILAPSLAECNKNAHAAAPFGTPVISHMCTSMICRSRRE